MNRPEVSLDAVIAHHVREAVREVVGELLAPVRADLAALKQAAPPALLDITAFCELAKCSQATARRWAQNGEVKVVRRGRVLRFDANSIRPPDDETIADLAAKARAR
jgi:hypothetical protein